MRAFALAIVAIHVGLAHPACAQTPADADRSISEMLPLFERHHCAAFKEPADQLFCGDPELNAASAKLNGAIQERLNRLLHPPPAIEEKTEKGKESNTR